jgi:hypothetical protein
MSETPKGVADHPAKNLMEEIWRSGGRAKEIVEFLSENSLPLVKESTIARYGQRFWTENMTISVENSSAAEIASTLQDIEESGLAHVVKLGYSKKKFPGWEKVDGQNVQVEKESTAWNVDLLPLPPQPAKAEIGKFSV